jgi:hypothetical protein
MNNIYEWNNPEWNKAGRVHDWRNYINKELQNMWPEFTNDQQRALFVNANELASKEEWD